MSTFAETMRRLRFERHMTQEEFAELLGTTKQNISRYESGAVSPKIKTAQIIADKLGISLSEFSDEGNVAQAKHQSNEIQVTASTRSKRWRMLSEAFGKMEDQNEAEFMAYFNMLVTARPDLFEERDDDDDPES